MICLFSQKRKLRLRESEFDSSVAAEGGIPAESSCPDNTTCGPRSERFGFGARWERGEGLDHRISSDSIISLMKDTAFFFFSVLPDFILFFPFIFISWRLITLQYCSGFCHTLT